MLYGRGLEVPHRRIAADVNFCGENAVSFSSSGCVGRVAGELGWYLKNPLNPAGKFRSLFSHCCRKKNDAGQAAAERDIINRSNGR